jgi:alanine racemase
VEGVKLRREGIKKPILVLGPTLSPLHTKAGDADIALTIASFPALKAIAALKHPPPFHLKIDTGMHRQGFLMDDIPKVVKVIRTPNPELRTSLKGLYTHFAAAKDLTYPTYTKAQFAKFQKAIQLFQKAGYRNLTAHCAATGATLIDKAYHCDAVRVGIGLYGLWPSAELEVQMPRITLYPILSWRAVVSEVKPLERNAFIGYDLTERAKKSGVLAVVPIGYWHGYPRALSSVGEVILRGKKAKVLGRVSMDLIALQASGLGARAGDVVTLIGKEGEEECSALDLARLSGTTHYEILTRLNPLMERVVV